MGFGKDLQPRHLRCRVRCHFLSVARTPPPAGSSSPVPQPTPLPTPPRRAGRARRRCRDRKGGAQGEDCADTFVQCRRCSPQSGRANKLSLRTNQRGRHVQVDRGMAPHAPLPGHVNAFLTERARATVVAQFQGGERAKRLRQDGRVNIFCSLAERQGLLAPGRRRPSQEQERAGEAHRVSQRVLQGRGLLNQRRGLLELVVEECRPPHSVEHGRDAR